MSHKTNVRRIRQMLLKTLSRDPEPDYTATVEALTDLLTFYMAMACENCRKRTAKELAKGAPAMLEHANEMAVKMTARDPARRQVCDIRHLYDAPPDVADPATYKAAVARIIRSALRLTPVKRRILTDTEVWKRIEKAGRLTGC